MSFRKGLVALVLLWVVIVAAVVWASDAHADPDVYQDEVSHIIADEPLAMWGGLAVCLDIYQGTSIEDELTLLQKGMAAKDAKVFMDAAISNLCPEVLPRHGNTALR